MQYTYLRTRPLDRDEKVRWRTSLLTLLCIRFNLPPRMLGWILRLLGSSNRTRLANRLLKLARGMDAYPEPQLLNWTLSYAHPGVVKSVVKSLGNSSPATWQQAVMTEANPQLLLRCEYLTPDFQKMQTSKGRPGSALLCIAGNALRLNMPVQLFHCAAAEHFDLLLYLRDFSRQRFVYGIPGLGRDIDELAGTLRTHIPDGCHLSILGTSGGGIAATRVAERLNADRLALFSPAFRFKDIAAVSGGAALDSSNALLYFSARHEKDMELADVWRTTVLGKSIRLLDTESHGTLSYVAAAGQLGRLIGWLRGGPPPVLT